MSILRNSNKKFSYLTSAGTANQISPIEDNIKSVRDPEIQHNVGVSPPKPPHYHHRSTSPSSFSFSSSSPSSSRGRPARSWSRSCLPHRPRAAPTPSSSSPSSHPLMMLREFRLLGFGAFCCRSLFLLVLLLVQRRWRREAAIGLELDLRLHLLLFALAFGVLPSMKLLGTARVQQVPR
ncbi:hypothetical protein EUGRSUZ_C00594 [Eucalyptus grandis]|uniref:Uncharacterized protein n=2 Tax=Eucalyptus grandis TaxID=71139 RepID=A0A059CL86_EUCGR|nr:hypothetical protein EUGRSUZ_C00594 [Eucalyptus grandis]